MGTLPAHFSAALKSRQKRKTGMTPSYTGPKYELVNGRYQQPGQKPPASLPGRPDGSAMASSAGPSIAKPKKPLSNDALYRRNVRAGMGIKDIRKATPEQAAALRKKGLLPGKPGGKWQSDGKFHPTKRKAR